MLAAMDILVLPGDGIGPEITAATASVLVAADRVFALGLTLTEAEIGLVTLGREGTTLPPAVMTAARGGRDRPRAGVAQCLSAARGGRHQRLRRAAHRPRPLRQYPTEPVPA